MAALRLRVEDGDFGMKQITVRDGKGAKERYTVLGASQFLGNNIILTRRSSGLKPR